MNFRFKTKSEFIEENLWVAKPGIPDEGHPYGWNEKGLMNSYLGKDIPSRYSKDCEKKLQIHLDRWRFRPENYKEVKEVVQTPVQNISLPTSGSFDLDRLAQEIDDIFQPKLSEFSTSLENFKQAETKFQEAATKDSEIRVKRYKEEISKCFKDIREELLEEVKKGRIIFNLPDGRTINISHSDHPKMADVVKSLNMSHKAMLVGPAGTGKTYMIAEIAKRMNLPFYKYSCSRDSSVHDLLGYKQPRSETYLQTAFLQAYENGGVFLVDEYDAMSGDMALFFNGVADSSKFIAVPHRDEKPVATKHKDFYLVMCGNTWGKGSIDYSGRDFQDMALMDRFRFCRHFIGYHTDLEKAFTGSNYPFVQKLRIVLESTGSYLSTRNIEDIAMLMDSGTNKSKIVEMTIEDLDDDAKRTVKSNML